MNKILVTDTLFIFPEHEARLRSAGFEVERLPKPDATEAELVEAVKGKVGYILGGIERVTDRVVEAGTELKAIVFTGADVFAYVPGADAAKKQGVLLANTPGANSFAVAEYSVMLTLLMLRRGLELGRTGKESFITTESLQDAHVGIVGLGRIGERVARMLTGMGAKRVSYWNRSRKTALEQELGIDYLEAEELFATCDVVSNHLPTVSGQPITGTLLNKLKHGGLFVSTGGDTTFDNDALYDLLADGRVRAAFDMHSAVPDDRYRKLPESACFYSNANAAYNTHAANKLASDMATESILNILTKGSDEFVVNSVN